MEGNNNPAERELRDDAKARRTDRTSKTSAGAKRRSIITSVLRSTLKKLPQPTLAGVIAEVRQWVVDGKSCFRRWLEASGLSPPVRATSLLDRLVLQAAD